MKSGVTRRRAGSSHTAALAGSEAAVAALFRQAGVIRSATLEELVDVAALLSSQPLPRGTGVAVLTNAGGLGILCADACDAAGLELPELAAETRASLAAVLPPEASTANPVDMLGSASAELYERALPHVLADPGVDAVVVIFVPAASRAGGGRRRRGRPGPRGPPAEAGARPCLMAAERQPGSFAYPESAARALGRAAERSAWLRRPVGTELVVEGVDRSAGSRRRRALARGRRRSGWSRRRCGGSLGAYGMLLVPERTAAGPDEAAAAAAEVGFPVVVKTAEPGAHKTETGGVALDLADEDEVAPRPRGSAGPVIVQAMVEGGVELLAGIVQDPVFGPLVAFGPGGVLAELIGEARFRLAPLTDVDAAALVTAARPGGSWAGSGAGRPPTAGARRPPRPPLAPRRGLRRARRARPQPGARPWQRLRRGRRADPRPPPAPATPKTW